MSTVKMPPQIGLKYGAFSGLGSILLFIIIYIAGYYPLGLSSFLGIWIMPLCIILGLNEYSQHSFFKPFTYWRAFWCAFNICMASTLLFTSLVYIFGSSIGKDLMHIKQINSLYWLEKWKYLLPREEYVENLKTIDLTNIGTIVSSDFSWKILGGTIVAFVAAWFFKQNKTKNPIETGFNEQQ
jgi:hypothetical protein